MAGWVKTHRKLADSDLWLSETFTRGQAWLDIILLANHKDGFIRVNGKRIIIKRGQLGWSELKLGKRWSWSRGKVKRFIKELIADRRIEQKIVQRNSCITICNYEQYQGNEISDSTTIKTTGSTIDGQQADNRQDTNKKVKNVKKVKKEKLIKPDFFTDEEWEHLKTHRTAKKAPMTELAVAGLIREFKKTNLSVLECIEEMAVRGWVGFNAEWVNKKGAKNGSTKRSSGYVEAGKKDYRS